MRISDWSSDVCSSDLSARDVVVERRDALDRQRRPFQHDVAGMQQQCHNLDRLGQRLAAEDWQCCQVGNPLRSLLQGRKHRLGDIRSEEHTSELQSLMRISYAVFCLKKKKNQTNKPNKHNDTNP